jgi:ATP-binding cassette subfamily B (MDR/TAP) protein 1
MSVVCQAISTFLASSIFGFLFNWRLSLVTLAFMPLTIFGATVAIKIISSHSISNKESTEKSAKIAIQAISAIRTVASLHQEKYFLSRYTRVLESNIKYQN